jgi:CheY-like chemotaxis protein
LYRAATTTTNHNERLTVKKQIMVVDDEIGVRALVNVLLKRHGFGVQMAQDAFAALELMKASTADLFVLDVMMPDMDGFELCERIRADPRLAQKPVIFLTALADVTSRKRALAVGANGILNKINLHQNLVTTICDLLCIQNTDARQRVSSFR